MAVIESDQFEGVTNEEIPVLFVTPAATETIRTLLQQRQIPNHALRVFVTGGGCSGMQYGMAFEEAPADYDTVVNHEGIRLLVDPTSMMYLQGSTIDFVDSLVGGGFRIDNPNAASSCGCGKSFRSTGESAAGEEAGCDTCSY